MAATKKVTVFELGNWVVWTPTLRGDFYHFRLRNKKTGQLTSKSSHTKSRAGAMRMIRSWCEEQERISREGIAEYVGFTEAFDEWFEKRAEKKKWAPTTKRDYESVRKLLCAHFGNEQLTEIRLRDVQRFVDKREREVTPQTARKVGFLLRPFFKKALGEELTTRDPTHGIDFSPRIPPAEKYALSFEEARAFVAACAVPDKVTTPAATRARERRRERNGSRPRSFAGDVVRLAVLLSFYSGLRKGDALSLRWSELDLDGGWLERKVNKGRRKGQTIRLPLHQVLAEALRAARAETTGLDVFGVASLTKPFERARKRAGLPASFTWHAMRKTLGAWLDNADRRESVCRAILGHVPKDAHGVYKGPDDASLRDAIDSLPDLTAPAPADTSAEVSS